MPRAKASAWNSNLRLRTVRQKDSSCKDKISESETAQTPTETIFINTHTHLIVRGEDELEDNHQAY